MWAFVDFDPQFRSFGGVGLGAYYTLLCSYFGRLLAAFCFGSPAQSVHMFVFVDFTFSKPFRLFQVGVPGFTNNSSSIGDSRELSGAGQSRNIGPTDVHAFYVIAVCV